MEKGLLFVVSAPAGCGKDTILEQLFKVTENVGYSVSATSRAPREGEVDGVHYHFRTREQFEQMIKNEEVLEYTEYCGNYYGTPRKAVEDMLNAGKDVILKIEVEGAMNIKRLFPECCLVFILPPSMQELERRLRKRGTETEEKIIERTAQAREELKFAENYDYLIVNGALEKAVDDLRAVISAEKLRKVRQMPLLTSSALNDRGSPGGGRGNRVQLRRAVYLPRSRGAMRQDIRRNARSRAVRKRQQEPHSAGFRGRACPG